MKKILFSLFSLFVLTLYFSGIYTMNVQIGDATGGVRYCSIHNASSERVGWVSVTEGKVLDVFTSPKFESIDRTTLPSCIVPLIGVIKKIKTKQNLDKVAMIGDLYITQAYRGKGYAYAQQLLDKACQYCFDAGFNTIALIPDPFEYENGQQKCLEGSPDYETKKQKLIQLYQKCGFSIDKADEMLFMYRTLNN
jgi:GNAT superfamily N-acetyltransferase